MTNEIRIPSMMELAAEGKRADVLFWVGCAGSYDQRYKSVTWSIVRILNKLNISFAVLGEEEACTGDPARRSGDEFTFQMQAMMNIEVMNNYQVGKIITACPHCFNTLKNEYPALGGSYEVVHHSQFLQQLMDEGKLGITGGAFKGKRLTYHDSCYLGRANDVYKAPRDVLEKLDADLVEMQRRKKNGLCCGAGGGQMFKDAEKGTKEINIERTEEAINTGADVVAVACPFCMTMLLDGVKHFEKEQDVKVLDIAEVIDKSM